MKTNLKCLPVMALMTATLLAGNGASAMEEHRWLTGINLDQLELRDTDDGTVTAWDARAWLGDDLNRFILNSEGDYLHGDQEHDSETEEAELQLLYSRAVAAYWDFRRAGVETCNRIRNGTGWHWACKDWHPTLSM